MNQSSPRRKRLEPWLRWLLAGTGVILPLLVSSCSSREQPTPSRPYDELARTLTDLRLPADLGAPAAQLASSYDRAGGNNDYNNPQSVDADGWAVLADLAGPGYVSRFWFTGAESGKYPLRFYFDGESTPRWDTTLGDFCGSTPPFTTPLAAYEPFCWYSLVPVPYQKRLVVKTKAGGYKKDGWPRIFYQIGAVKLADGNGFASPGKAMDEPARQALAAAAGLLRQGASGEDESGWKLEQTEGVVAPGGKLSLAVPGAPGVIREFKLTPDLKAFPDFTSRNEALRSVVLRIFWDDAGEPSVETPLGDFFGSMWERRRYASRYFGMTNDTFFSRFPMPFARDARVELENPSGVALPVKLECRVEPLATWSDQLGYFHAGWNKTTAEQTGTPHVFVRAQGRGRYLGCLLSTMSLDKSWWLLEGDEYGFIDGEAKPGWHGTGLEDYFNGGWYYGSALAMPYHGIPFKAHFRTIQYRIHQVDPIAFNTSLSMEIERGPDNASHGVMESVAFYYLAAPQKAYSDLRDPAFRKPPVDPLAEGTVMTEINDMERLGDYTAAHDFIGALLERQPGYSHAEILRLRQLIYRARESGFAAVRDEVSALAQATANPAVRAQAEDWLWFHGAEDRGLLALYCNSPAQAYLDGKFIGASGDPQRIQVYRVTLPPGAHALSLKVKYRDYPYWALACLHTHTEDVYTSPAWKYEYPAGEAWASAAFDDSGWPVVGGAEGGKGPPEEPYIWLEPHAYPGVQAKAKGLWVAGEWLDRNRWAVFRKSFTTN